MKKFWDWFRTHTRIRALLLSAPWLLVTLGVTLYYIIGPSVGYFHSDCADSILWANATVESGKIFAEDFHYAALLPFGSTVWMAPVVAIFGLTMRAQIISMVIFALLFIAASVFFFRSMKWSYPWSTAATCFLTLTLSISAKLREIMWEHTIYYSLGILFLLLLLGLLFRLTDAPWEKGKWTKFIVYSVLLFLVCLGCGMDGFQILVITVVPTLGALVLYTLFDGETPLFGKKNSKSYFAAALIIVGTAIGFLVLSALTKAGNIHSDYENSYSLWSDLSAWWNNASRFFERWFSLFGIEIKMSRLFTKESFLAMIKLLFAAVILVCPWLLLASWRKIRDRYTKIVLLSHVIVTCAILFGFICGVLSDAAWRLTPLVASSTVATLLYLRYLISACGIVGKRIGVLVALVLTVGSLMTVKTIASMPVNYGRDDSIYEVLDALEQRGLDYGYATFWNASRTTLLSDGKVRVRNVNVLQNGISPNRYQSSEAWYKDQEGQESYFLMLTDAEYATFKASAYYGRLTMERQVLSYFQVGGYHIYEFNGNIFLD